jgi:S-DNA-T family DNA segregation ATPase FtsK/SpoIIIE
MWLGLARINMGLRLLPRPLLGFGIFVLSGAVFLGSQTWWFQDWWKEYNILGPGGGLGHLGKIFAQKTINLAGAVIISLTGYVAGLILMTGIRPRAVSVIVQRTCITAWRQIMFRLSGKRRALLQKVEEKEAAQLLSEQKKTERERRRLEKELRRQPAVDDGSGAVHIPLNRSGSLDIEALEEEVIAPANPPAPRSPIPALTTDEDEEDAQPLPAAPIEAVLPPEPEIINGSKRNVPSGEPKLSLAEWRKQQQKPREENAAAGAAGPAGKSIDFSNYQLPPLNILHWDESAADVKIDERGLRETQRTIIGTLATFGIQVTPGPITRGPTISRYEIYPSEGLRVNKITALEADIARATRAERINILAPIPGKDTVGIEIANDDKIAIPLRELLEDDTFARTKAKLPLALGKDVYGNTIIADLAAMPHLLVAGATGSG